ncbi:hypothetical protein BASA81_010579 [Batrachochytrium salamandrivorans]|nr:hypothetical protein BASA81_010579 [Batrachochytrium salamandrivorans]
MQQGLQSAVKEASENGTRPCLVVVDPKVSSLLAISNLPNVLFESGATKQVALQPGVVLDWREDGPVVFVLKTNPQTCRTLSLQLRQQLSKTKRKQDFRVVLLPRRSFRCEEVFREEHVLAHISSLQAVHVGFVQLEENLWTLELDEFLLDCKVVGDTSPLAFAARALMDLGHIRHVRSKGHSAKEVLDLYLRMKRENKPLQQGQGGRSREGRGRREEEEDSEGDGDDDEEDGEGERDSKVERGGPLDLMGMPLAHASPLFPPIDTLVLLDRELDMISPLSTPLTYESQLDECFGLKAGYLKVHRNILRLDDDEEEESEGDNGERGEVEINLNHDELFQEIRAVSVTDTMRVLNEKARDLKDTQEQVHRTRNVEDLQDFVKRIPELQARKRHLSVHIALGRRVSAVATDRKFRQQWHAERELIETGDGRMLLERAQDLAARGGALVKVLRLLCLHCVLTGGFSPQALDQVRQDLIHVYGFDIMFTLDHLDRAGLLTQRPFHPQHKFSAAAQAHLLATAEHPKTRCVFPNFAQVKAGFNLVPSSSSEEGGGVEYVFAGMAPLSVRLVELAISPGWDSKTDLLKMVGDGPTICRLASDATAAAATPPAPLPSAGKRVMVVLFLGGVCHAEIAALRTVGSRPDCPYRIVVATTAVVTGSSLIQSFFHSATGAHE